MIRLSKNTFSKIENAIKDFGYDSNVLELSISRGSSDSPISFNFTVESDKIYFVNCTSPSDIQEIGGFYLGWAIKIYDLNKIEGFHHDFGRYVIEFRDDEDDYPLYYTVDSIEVNVEQS